MGIGLIVAIIVGAALIMKIGALAVLPIALIVFGLGLLTSWHLIKGIFGRLFK